MSTQLNRSTLALDVQDVDLQDSNDNQDRPLRTDSSEREGHGGSRSRSGSKNTKLLQKRINQDLEVSY